MTLIDVDTADRWRRSWVSAGSVVTQKTYLYVIGDLASKSVNQSVSLNDKSNDKGFTENESETDCLAVWILRTVDHDGDRRRTVDNHPNE